MVNNVNPNLYNSSRRFNEITLEKGIYNGLGHHVNSPSLANESANVEGNIVIGALISR